jgi:uncharacterized protein involved in exopolysaccharide biosynthesis
MDILEQSSTPDDAQPSPDVGAALPWWARTGVWVATLAAVVAVVATVMLNSAASAAGGCGGG